MSQKTKPLDILASLPDAPGILDAPEKIKEF